MTWLYIQFSQRFLFCFYRILRSAGLVGEVTATWQITPADTAVFTTASTVVTFADRQSEAVITVQVRYTRRHAMAIIFCSFPFFIDNI